MMTAHDYMRELGIAVRRNESLGLFLQEHTTEQLERFRAFEEAKRKKTKSVDVSGLFRADAIERCEYSSSPEINFIALDRFEPPKCQAPLQKETAYEGNRRARAYIHDPEDLRGLGMT